LIYFNPKNPEIEKIFDRFIKHPGTILECDKVHKINQYKTIRKLREKDHMFIGKDDGKHKTIIFFPPNVKITKHKNGFSFRIF